MKLFFSIALFLAIVISQAQTTTLDSLKKVFPDIENEQKLTTLFRILNKQWAENRIINFKRYLITVKKSLTL